MISKLIRTELRDALRAALDASKAAADAATDALNYPHDAEIAAREAAAQWSAEFAWDDAAAVVEALEKQIATVKAAMWRRANAHEDAYRRASCRADRLSCENLAALEEARRDGWKAYMRT